jgi:hypothetical protein
MAPRTSRTTTRRPPARPTPRRAAAAPPPDAPLEDDDERDEDERDDDSDDPDDAYGETDPPPAAARPVVVPPEPAAAARPEPEAEFLPLFFETHPNLRAAHVKSLRVSHNVYNEQGKRLPRVTMPGYESLDIRTATETTLAHRWGGADYCLQVIGHNGGIIAARDSVPIAGPPVDWTQHQQAHAGGTSAAALITPGGARVAGQAQAVPAGTLVTYPGMSPEQAAGFTEKQQQMHWAMEQAKADAQRIREDSAARVAELRQHHQTTLDLVTRMMGPAHAAAGATGPAREEMDELRRQNRKLSAKNEELRETVAELKMEVLEAKLDAKAADLEHKKGGSPLDKIVDFVVERGEANAAREAAAAAQAAGQGAGASRDAD